MRIRFIPLILAVLFLTPFVFAQFRVVPKEVTYTRKGNQVPDFKKTFTVRYPVVEGIALKGTRERLKNTISYWKNFDTTLEDNLNGDYWMSSLDYKVNYLNRGLLDIDLTMEGSGAYPDAHTKTLVVDLNTGGRLFVRDVFTNIGALVLKIDRAQKAEIKSTKAQALREGLDDTDTYDSLISETVFGVSKMDEFSISEKGVTFIYDYGFPHAFKALEPEGRYFFSWNELRPYVKKRGRLSGFYDSFRIGKMKAQS